MSLSIKTLYGVVAGGHSRGACYWRGVPYAKAERFGLPLPPDTWTNVRLATKYGLECPQCFPSLAPAKKIDGPEVGEDCLVLNIWAPDITSLGNDVPLKPVMVWIHGGAFMAGSGNMFNGAHLAVKGDMIIVSINYRLGVLGFANLGDALNTKEIPSNLGIRDQIAALEWVRDNIEAFGGDPNRVTIAGESAGSLSISLLMICQKAWPLFHGAILESGATSLIHNRELSHTVGQHYCEALKINEGELSKLRSMDIKTLITAQTKVQEKTPGNVPAAPWYDGDLLPASLAEARLAPTANVPVMAGFNREEIRTFEWMKGPDILPMTRAANEKLIRQQLPPAEAEKILTAYSDTKEDNRALATHLTFGMPTLHFAERHSAKNPTWFYRFDYKHPLLGAAHAIELVFIWQFPGLMGFMMRGGLLMGKRKALTERIQNHWCHFVNHGKPANDWPAFDISTRAIHLFNLTDDNSNDPDAEKRIAWNDADVSNNENDRYQPIE